MMNEEDFLDYNSYLRKQAKINPKFATENAFRISDEEIKQCKDIMKEIDIKNVQISKCENSFTRNSLNRQKGKLLEHLAKLLLNSTDLFIIYTNIRDHTNEIDLLITPSDYNRIYSVLLPQYLREDILVECKNYNSTIKVDWVGKFSSLINTHRVKMGIIFSYKEFAGKSEWQSSKGLSKKIFLAEEKAIININFDDINKILNKHMNVVQLIECKYDALKHHVDYSKLITKHPAEI